MRLNDSILFVAQSEQLVFIGTWWILEHISYLAIAWTGYERTQVHLHLLSHPSPFNGKRMMIQVGHRTIIELVVRHFGLNT